MPRRSTFIIFALAASCAAAVAGNWAGRWFSPRQRAETQPILVIDPTNLNFGEVWATEQFDWKLLIRNTTDSEVILESLSGDCSCVAVSSLPLKIGANKERQLGLRLDLTRRCMGVGSDPFASIPHPIKLRGTVRNGDRTDEVIWVLEGRVKPAVILSKRRIDFGRLWDPPSQIDRVIALRTASEVDLHSVTVNDGMGRLSAEFHPTSSAAAPELVVHLDPRVLPGLYRAEVRVLPVTKAGEVLGAVRLPVEWENLHEIQPDTTTLDFGVHPLGSVAEQTLTLTSLAGKPFLVTECKTDQGVAIIFDKPLGEMAVAVTLRVSQRVDHSGDHAGELTVTGVTGADERFAIKCQTHCFGIGKTGP